MQSNIINVRMPAFCASLYQTMEEKLTTIADSSPSQLLVSERSLQLLTGVITDLHGLVSVHTFTSTEEEIHFFKHIKPLFYSRLILHQTLLQFELRYPVGNTKAIRKYLDAEFDKLQQFFMVHRDVYEYYRSGATYQDNEYSLRNGDTRILSVDPSYFNGDPLWCTTQDYVFSRILANEEVRDYLSDIIRSATDHQAPNEGQKTVLPALSWTAPKAALVEILYALQSSGVFNNGVTDIKQLALWFEQHFAIQLGNYYHIFQELRLRKKNRTSFLDQLKEKLTRRMDEADDRMS